MDLSQKTLGAKIAALRKIRNMTQEQLAAQLGISAPAVSKNGRPAAPTRISRYWLRWPGHSEPILI